MKLIAAIIASATLSASPAIAAPLAPGLHTGVTFDRTTPLSSTAELVRRTFSPLTVDRITAAHTLAGQPVDISRETFTVYMPARKPAEGYALLVFVPPWDTAKLPPEWASVLDDKGVIFVSANHSGNDAKVESRRMPLAIIAAEQMREDYRIVPSRVLVGGFSGGSRAALRLALAYPDVFAGALLNSGADPIGTAAIPLPPADLMQRFQENSRIYLITGDLDNGTRNMQAASETSLQGWCASDVHDSILPHTGHTTADPSTLLHALDTLLDATPAKHDGLPECRARLQNEMETVAQHVEAVLSTGDKAAARQMLTELDAKFGGLAAREILALEKKLQ